MTLRARECRARGRQALIEVALSKLGAQASLGTPVEFRAFLAAERLKWSSIIQTAGIKID